MIGVSKLAMPMASGLDTDLVVFAKRLDTRVGRGPPGASTTSTALDERARAAIATHHCDDSGGVVLTLRSCAQLIVHIQAPTRPCRS